MKQIFTLLLAVLISYGLYAQVSVTRSGTNAFTTPKGSGQTWSSTNVLSSNNQYASSLAGSLIGSGSTITDYMVVKSLGFTVPLNATINAVQVRIEKKRFAGNVYDHTVQLLKGGTASGNNKAATATNWPVSDTYTAYGNTTNDLWGLTLTPFDVNSPNFSVRVAATLNNPSIVLGAAGADIDHIEVTVTYTLIATDKDNDGVVDVFDLNNSLPVVIQNGMLNGGTVGNPAGAGALGPLQKTTTGQTDRDWRTTTLVLPLQLIVFMAQPINQQIRLNWQTQNEQNVLHIIVEKSTDGIHFNSIGQLPAHNTATASYQFNDALPAADNYYRLKMVDRDGSSQTSQVIYTNIHMTVNTPRLFPNPLKDLLFIECPASCLHHTMEITLINQAGQAVRNFRVMPTRPVSTLQVGWLQPGSYLIQLIVPSKNIRLSQQVIAQ